MVIGNVNKISIAENSAKTPPSLFGIDRRIAYSHKKYHSGLICVGVTSGFDIMKFSGSVNILGLNRINDMNVSKTILYPRASLIE